MQWVYVSGNWGDIIVMLSQYCDKYKEFGVMCNFHPDADVKNIIKFLHYQKFILKIICLPHHPENMQDIQDIINKIGFTKVDITKCHLYEKLWTKNIKTKLSLNDIYYKNITIPNVQDSILLHPYSIVNSSINQHWPHWIQLMLYLFEKTNYQYILTGLNFDAHLFDKYSNVINLVNNKDIIKDNCDLFALANKVKYTITTSNSLAHWCTNQNNPSYILGNYNASIKKHWEEVMGNKNCVYYDYNTNLYEILYNITNKLRRNI